MATLKDKMELVVRASLICLLAVFVSGAEEPADPPEEPLTISKLEDANHHGPLMKALLAPGQNSSSLSPGGPELQRDKRHKKWYGQRGTFWKKKGGGGGCGYGCGGGGGYYVQPVKVIVVPVKGGGCGHGGCGGRPTYNHYPSQGGYCNTCGNGGGGGGGSWSYSSSSAGSWSGKKK